MIKLRPYQTNTTEAVKKSFASGHRNTILCAPTGSGKTVMFSDIILKAAKRSTRCLVLTDRLELFKQTLGSLVRVNISVQELNAKTRLKDFDPLAIVTLGMVETIKRRKLTDYDPQLIIIDEAHKGNFSKVIEQYPNARIIGATATPVGKHIPKYYTDIVSIIDIPELIDNGFLSPCRPYQMQDDFSDLKTNRGEYTDSSLFEHFAKKNLYAGVIENWKKYAENKKTIVFNVNIEHTEQMHTEFKAAGIHSEFLTSNTTTEERNRILKAFKDGLFPVLNNCGILTTGYDEPSIECVIMNRKTKSLPLWLQCCGRGSRIFPGKTEFVVLDFGRNHDEHGLWAEPRDWKLEQPKKKKKLQAAPVKDCPKCAAMVAASARVCAFCGHLFSETKKTLEEGVMVEVKSIVPEELIGVQMDVCTVDQLIKLQQVKRFSAAFIWRVVRSNGAEAVRDYAKKMNYKQGWVKRQLDDLENSEFQNIILR
tara:strand:- start:15367 stop:16806 length:1440 start_codon:yes stop_codon:yes gene_type:complete